MKIWLIQLGEPLPCDKDIRLYRTGILANMLAEHGHAVTWWSATFNHTHKRQRFANECQIELNNNYRLKLLQAHGYKKNVSLARILYHQQMAFKFSRSIELELCPDIILSSLPTPELSKVATDYARHNKIPIVIDVRDLWPDTFIDMVPRRISWLGKWMLSPLFKVNRYVFGNATGIIGISNSYLNWGLSYAKRTKGITDRVFPLGYSQIKLSSDDKLKTVNDLRSIGVDPSKKIFCFFGVFGNTYDLETVAEAAKILNHKNNNIQFVLCGDGEKLNSIKRRVADLNNVILPGWITPLQIATIMDISTAGLAPYTNSAPQSLPNKPFEYLSGGLPIISSLRGELRDILSQHNCGFTYQAGNADELASIILQLSLQDDSVKEMSANAEHLFKTQFDSNKIYPEIISYLQDVVINFNK